MGYFLTASSNLSVKTSCGNHEFWWSSYILLSLLTLLTSLSRDGLKNHWILMRKTLIFWWREQINKWGGASTLKAQFSHTEVVKESLSGERAECTESLGGLLVIGLHLLPKPPLFLSSSVPIRLAGPPSFGLTGWQILPLLLWRVKAGQESVGVHCQPACLASWSSLLRLVQASALLTFW